MGIRESVDRDGLGGGEFLEMDSQRMPLRSIKQAPNLKNKRVLVRVDFNVPIKNGNVADDTRLRVSLSTIRYLQKKKARVILLTHIGRPGGKVVEDLSVKPIAKRLSSLLHCHIVPLPHLQADLSELKSGDVALLENTRFYKGDEENDSAFAKRLASLGDIFVLDGFAVSHRSAASVVGVAKYLPSYMGLLLEEEMTSLNRVVKSPKHPFVVVIGGAKIETKLPIITHLLSRADHILVGGAIISTYLATKGYSVGASLVDSDVEKKYLMPLQKRKIMIPVDLVVGNVDGTRHRVVAIVKMPHVICGKGEAIFDIGPKTRELFQSVIAKAKTLAWNGAMGYFEQKPYDKGTRMIARAIADRSCQRGVFSVIGGGETVQAMEMVHRTGDIDLVSTGGGAMLEYLSGKKLPGIEALKRK